MKNKKRQKTLFIVVNVDWFFLSHRLPIALAAMEAGYDVTILAADTGSSQKILRYGLSFINVPFERSGTNILYEFKCLNILRLLYIKYRPDIVHHVTIKVALYGSIAARLASVKCIVNAISGLGYNFTGNRKGLFQMLLQKVLKLGFHSRKTRFIFQNEDDIAVFKKLNIVEDSQISLIKGSGVNLLDYYEVPLPLTPPLVVLFCARMLYDKGIIEFIEAAEILRRDFYGQVTFILAGDIDSQNLASLTVDDINSLIDGDYINWIGHQTNMFETLKKAHIVVLPSYREGLPKSLIEAAAVGRPIVTTNVPGCKECVIHGYNGYLVPEKNSLDLALSIKRLLVDRETREHFAHNSRLLAENEFSIDNVISKTLDIYNSFQE